MTGEQSTMLTGETDVRTIQITVGEPVGFGDGALHAPEQSTESLAELGETIVNKYLTKVEADAPGVCMDGRPCECLLHNKDAADPVGPKSAGGPLQTAFAAAETIEGWYGLKSSEHSSERVREVEALLTGAGIAIGGHTTAGAQSNGYTNPETGAPQTGCGAGEKHIGSTTRLVEGDANVLRLTDAMLGQGDNDIFVSETTMSARNADYDPRTMLDVETDETARRDGEVLTGDHGEVAVFINTVPDTSVDRDALVKETGKQVFVIDAWYLDKLAKAMTVGRPDYSEMYPKILRAMVAY